MKALRSVVILLLLMGVGLLGFWAGRVALESPTDPLATDVEHTSYVVESGSVSRSLSFTAVAHWDLTPVGRHSSSGVVTSVDVAPGSIVTQGQILYSVGLRPTVVAAGKVPMFRALRSGVEGADVSQLQRLLVDLGFLTDRVDGVFGGSTLSAVRDWQESLGLARTGLVEVGDLVFVETLPSRVVLGDQVQPGVRLTDGEVVLLVVPAHPVFRIPLAPEQASVVPLAADVLVHFAGGTWQARVERAVELEFGRLDLVLSAPGGGPVCEEVCVDWVGLLDETSFDVEVVVIPKTDGIIVPIGAIITDPGNKPSVMLTDNTLVPIEVIETANGLAVVTGLDPGTEILLLVGR